MFVRFCGFLLSLVVVRIIAGSLVDATLSVVHLYRDVRSGCARPSRWPLARFAPC